MADGYDPNKSKVSDDKMQDWLKSQVTDELEDVPGIGPKAAQKLAEGDESITNCYQLFGKFLMLRGPDSAEHKVESMEHAEKFWQWLKAKGISAHRSAIVKAIAEKSATFFHGIYDATEWEDEED
mmetsp:Transcript_21604/g.31953  ORF Transcript_21604/g.31953 Transcript_21604/m.31953 type:complete len:125 (+) Transcript_21604:117-491(+)|eukprot:CAMPEP_0194210578 /NCGR_PEP_ID=MMETSP0156-20130528/8766_1 /TAXON_ID=33649 /ORGANISM="Thalassionema nitzschioides, Strain L26-B" /LENGTH=124 /DNA_ID=CAMNT_0038937941 /DNA_START=89 /DNA_END=463 /DNA_ORIENTATION=-